MDKEVLQMIENFEKKTGTKIETWKKIISKSGLSKHGELVEFLKTEHGLTHGYANMVIHVVLDNSSASYENKDELIAKQFKGKENLRPLYDKLIEIFTGFGNDVFISPKLTYVSIKKKAQIAIIKPSTKTRIDIGLKLKGKKPDERFIDSGNFNSMCTHKVSVTGPEDIDKTLISWIKESYDSNT